MSEKLRELHEIMLELSPEDVARVKTVAAAMVEKDTETVCHIMNEIGAHEMAEEYRSR